ncbi:MAG TPA: TPM domain-containing protein [Patescibacteria group bacterium]|nr:TPM domain-containing protein [Patescibacteria group bacterium]
MIPARRLLAAIVAMLSIATVAHARGPNFPKLSGRVVDDAGVLSPQTIDELSQMSADQERASGQQIVVVTLKSLQGYSIEDFGYQLGRYWGIGQKGSNNGAILIVAPHEHKVRIEVGYGLEGTLTDAQSRIIIESMILPAFRRGDFDAGVLAGMQAIVQALGGNPIIPRPPAYPVVGANSIGTAPAEHQQAYASWRDVAIFLIWPLIFLGVLLMFMVSSLFNAANLPPDYYLRRSSGGSSGGGSWGGSGGDGGGGFSGGGGSFGGGGASGSW